MPEAHKGRLMSIRGKALFLMMLLVLLICAAFLSMIYRQSLATQNQMISSKVTASHVLADAIMSQFSRQYQQRIKSLLNIKASRTREEIVMAFARRNRDSLLQLSEPLLDVLRKENPYFASLGWILPDNRVFLRVHDPDYVSGDVGEMRPDVAAANATRQQQSGFTTSRQGPQYRVAEPVYYQGEYLGVLQMGIDARVLIDSLQEKLRLPAGFAIPNDQYENRLSKITEGLVAETHTIYTTDNALFSRLIEGIDWNEPRQRTKLDSKTFILQKILSLKDFRGERLGCMFVAIDITDITEEIHQSLVSVLMLCFLLLFLSYIIIHFSFGSLIEKIVRLNRSLEKSNRELEARVEERTCELLRQTEERQKAEERLHRAEKMEAIGLMASGVAHDLNNILSGVVSYPELLLMRLPEDSPLRKSINAIKESGLRAAAVVADLLTVARDAAKVRSRANLNKLVLNYLYSPEAREIRFLHPEVQISTDLAGDLPEICCSETHINKCIMNLVHNAAEAFNGKGDIRIRTALYSLPDENFQDLTLPDGKYLVLSVADNGPGIPEEDQDHIFEPFYTKKKMGRSGTGIGLTVVWNCMQDHNGGVTLRSDEQQGTAFYLFFPTSTEANCRPLEAVDDLNLQGRGETVLVVDDDERQRDIARELLTELGYRPRTAASGEDALYYFGEHEADLVLLDMVMEPGMDGCKTYEKIIALRPGQKAVVVSGYTEREKMSRIMALGAGSFLKKPYTAKELAVAVSRALRATAGDEG